MNETRAAARPTSVPKSNARKRARGEVPRGLPAWWPMAALFACLAYVTLEVYSPAVRGAFVYDDLTLPFLRPELASRPLWAWVSTVRPLMMLSFWVNYALGGTSPAGYHLLNLAFHLGAGAGLFLCLRALLWRRLAERATATVFAAFGTAVFLLHPVQTEAVAYVASRSETLSVCFFLAAFAAYLYGRRDDGIGWGRALLLVALAGCAMATKEHTIVLPAFLLLTERFWFAASWREALTRQWRLWVPFAVLGTVAGVAAAKVLMASSSAGFQVAGLRWYEYFFTQCRVVFRYVQLFLFPVGQNFDPDLALSRSLGEHGTWLGMLALVTAGWAAWRYRREFPLASYGLLTFLLLLAPTSSFIPIKDVMAERRLYLPMIGLLLIVLEWLVRWRKERALLVGCLTVMLILLAGAAWRRNQLWGHPVRLWEDTIAKSPAKLRGYQHLGHSYVAERRCQDAVNLFASVEPRVPQVPAELLVHWSMAYQCLHQPEAAIARLQQAAALAPDAAIYYDMGRLQYERGQIEQARASLERAVALQAPWDVTYLLLGDILKQQGSTAEAREQYRRAVLLNPQNDRARQELAELRPDAANGPR